MRPVPRCVWMRSCFPPLGVRGQAGAELSVMLHDRRAVRSLRDEFDAYLALCRPLVRRFEGEGARERVERFLETAGQVAALDAIGATVAVGEGRALVMRDGEEANALLVDEPRLADAISEYLRTLPAVPS